MDTTTVQGNADEIQKRILHTVSGIAVQHALPPSVHVVICDKATDKRYGSFVAVDYVGQRPGLARLTSTSVGELQQSATLLDVVNTLLEHYPGTPLVCDETTTQELGEYSRTSITMGHYHKLEMGSKGTIEVFTAYKSRSIPNLPSGHHTQIFER